ncbi:MAG: diguanylate cyclase [Gammaproteobacteria bacterium]|nr:diguanylate cyclase [Gammaproteobacteria bacterium]
MLLSATFERLPVLTQGFDLRRGLAVCAFLLFYLCLDALGHRVAASAGLVWHSPAAGLGLGLLLLYGPRYWPLAVGAGLLSTALIHGSTSPATWLQVPLSSLIYAGYAQLLARTNGLPHFDSTPQVGRFLLELPLAAMGPALIGLVLHMQGADPRLLQYTLRLWLGEMASLVVLTPAFLLLAPRLNLASLAWPRPSLGRQNWYLASLVGAVLLVGMALNPELKNPAWQVSLVALVLFLSTVGSGLMAGVTGTAAATGLLALVLMFLVELGGWQSVAPQFLVLCLTQGVAGLLYGVALTGFRELHAELEQTVAERTDEAHRRELSFRVLAEGSADVIALYTQHRRLLYLSPAVRELCGYAVEDIRSSLRFRKSLVHPDDWPRITSLFQALAHGEPVYAAQYRIRHRRGDWIWLESRARIAGSESLNEPHLVISTRDISSNKEAEDHWRSLAHQDALTGCLNRRGFEEFALEELWRAHRYQRPLSLLMLDIDHFKRINDQHGHDVGDAVLKHFAEQIQERCRRSERFARLGGEEFAILMPESSAASAQEFGERIRQLIADTPYLHVNGAIDFTVSLGLAELRADDDLDRLKKRADVALYLAKAEGRNRLLKAD